MRVFGESPSFYYELKDYQLDLAEIHDRLISFGLVDGLSFPNFQARTEKLRETIKADSNFSNLLNGIHVPFAVSLDKGSHDLGEQLETELLVKLESSFKASYPDLHFKAVIQGDVGLKEKISIEDSSRYSDLINLAQKSTVVGWYFPQALQEFDIQSQRKQMVDLPSLVGAHLCLSGGIDGFSQSLHQSRLMILPSSAVGFCIHCAFHLPAVSEALTPSNSDFFQY